MNSFSNSNKIIGALLILIVIAGVASILATASKNKHLAVAAIPSVGAVSLRGTILCLPHRNTNGPQTMECAYGLKDEKGNYYALHDSDPLYKNISAVPMNILVDVRGTFALKADTLYPTVGLIDVVDISLADNPRRGTLVGTYVCLPHKDASVQSKECKFGIKTAEGLYYGLDVGIESGPTPTLVVGDQLSAAGIVTPVEELSSDEWNQYPIEGIFSVTDSFEKVVK
jgi:hypothetical protein